ncbi:bifunctional phosphoribosylaminoimidazolecarboxamide formyltransferase/IMP cyclohydrolase [Synechococcales cyanobacterium C]|uniref:Bifunctional purine biosynthesis protein PurH n=1 Tax=Petrachloros mirabilis ULC683 TaxID=2781853 RepID=A0A8K2A6U9_9CYAN|nr:bifunctional phosphoribosylaminoimidazolecarboxamide formyltransferase/IMP cyclohydrolase [Petrachloros mirabilis]NCJ06216.1 bifunctional phosphoribosylaminoimidazolecarboxamide formyltransferase/IMP cyclohydrolase [Petrachloros mirabilis ULC683]
MPRLALLSTSDKTGLIEFAQRLVSNFDFTLLSSGGTAATLQAAGLPVTKVSDYTGAPEILGGRVKTLHPRVHGGILARRDVGSDIADLAQQNILPIDLVVVNLYPFEQTIAAQSENLDPATALAEAVEQIDIGGPAMLRAAAKNFAHVTVLCSPQQYEGCLQEMAQHQGQTSQAFRQACALQVFARTAAYDQAITTYLQQQTAPEATAQPHPLAIAGQPHQVLRYGENPHQSAIWHQSGVTPTGWTAATQIQGKALSYNNLVDLEAARQIIAEFAGSDDPPTAAILKHNNPCGVAQGEDLVTAYEKALAADSVSAFGGIVALNRPLDAATAMALKKTFLECVVTPACNPEAVEILKAKANLRVLALPDLVTGPPLQLKAIAGGWLAQATDDTLTPPSHWQWVTTAEPTADQRAELLFAWKVVKHVKSNAITVSCDRTTLGVGAGQMNRVGSVKIALDQAGEKAQGAVLASDGFFPFDDSVRTAAAAGITAIVQPGGSLRDGDSIQAANELGIVMAFTGTRHFLH